MSKSTRKIRRFNDEFKSRAVNLYKTSNKSYSELGEELGVPHQTMASWVLNPKYSKLRAGVESHSDEITKELKAIKRELTVIREERDILKKALAILSTNNQSK